MMKRSMLTNQAKPRPCGPNPFMMTLCCILACAAANVGRAENWPTYRADIGRGAVTDEQLDATLALQWTYVATHPPKPAWPTPSEEMPRMHTDSAFHVAVADGRAFFGSSVTNEVYALDAVSGDIAWTFFTEGPVRFAPTVANGRVYVGSDDGYVYCLATDSGALVWKYRAGPSDEKVIGNGRLISLWPVRTSVLVDRGVTYFAAGVFPYEGIYICALDANDGSVVWRNDTIGDRAHELSYGGISPHGYLLASEEALYVPSGRAMPAAFDRQTGKFLFWALPGGKRGGTWTLLSDNQLIAGVDYSGTPHKSAYDADTGRRKGDVFAWFPGIDMVISNDTAYVLTLDGIYAIDRDVHAEAVRKVNASAERRKVLGKELAQLREQAKTAQGQAAQKIHSRIEEITRLTAQHATEEKRLQESCYQWHFPAEHCGALILAGETLFAGGREQIIAVSTRTGRQVWQSPVSGNVLGLAAANGCLLASTDDGKVCCFANRGRASRPAEIKVEPEAHPYADAAQTQLCRDAARRIVEESGITEGYCLILDGGTGQLAYELAQSTDLQIVALEDNASQRRVARAKLKAAGLLGTRVIVESWDLDALPFYFANLIVSDQPLTPDIAERVRERFSHVLRPAGGTIVAGLAATQRCVVKRPELEGSGSWTHQYGNPQNTACSLDEITGGPLGLLWFGEPGPLSMVERHAKAQSPLAMDGRLFIQGEEVILAVDAYNGTILWRRQIPGAVRARADVDGGNLALSEEALYVAAYDKCLRLDPVTGDTVRVYELPGARSGDYRWGCVSINGKVLVGIRASAFKKPYGAELQARHAHPGASTKWAYKRSNALWFPMTNYPAWENYSEDAGSVTDQMMAGDMVFALDADTGQVLWTRAGRQIANLTLSVGDGKVFFADSDIAEPLQQQAVEQRRDQIRAGVYRETKKMTEAKAYEPADVRLAVALDVRSGRELWQRPIDFTGCCGDAMGSAYRDDVLLFFGCVGNHDAYRFRENQLAFRRIVAVTATTGEILWSRPLNYRTRPVVMGDKIIIEPRACDLHTGAIQTRTDPVTGEPVPWEFLRPGHTCAITSASASTLFYRSSSTAIYDVVRDAGVAIFGGIRPGCWINMIPADGLVLVPEASVGCTCSFPLRCSFALVNKPQRAQPWTVFVNHTELDAKGRVIPDTFGKPVKHLAINFGAPADMKDRAGTVWLAYPNPKTAYSQNHFTNYGMKFDLAETLVDDTGFFCQDFKGLTIAGTDKPWLFTSGCLGLLRCEVPLLDESSNGQPCLYTVRLAFRPQATDKIGRRCFDIKLQGQTVARDFDVAAVAAGADRAVVRQFTNVAVRDNLLVEFVPHGAATAKDQVPLVNAIEVIRQEATALAKGNAR